MRIVYLALGRDLRARDAGTTHTNNIIKALHEIGIKITLIAKNTEGAPDNIRTIDCDLPKMKTFRPPADVIKDLFRKTLGADLIHERAEESGGLGVKLAGALECPLVLEVNTPLSGHPSPVVRKLADWNLRRQAKAAQGIITQTSISKHIIENYTETPVHVIPNGADGDLFNPKVEPAKLPVDIAGRSVVAFAGSLRPWHGVEGLILAGKLILTAQPKAFFLVIGGGERREAIEQLAETHLGRGNYHFTGEVPPAQVPGYLAVADLLAAPFAPEDDPVRASQFSRYGMWWSPVKVFEYMAMGRPIVACSAGTIAEYLTHCGIMVPAGNTVMLARAVSRLLGDQELAESLGGQARERFLSHYTWKHAAKATLTAWKEVLNGPQNASLKT